jgi:hypothetical protein
LQSLLLRKSNFLLHQSHWPAFFAAPSHWPAHAIFHSQQNTFRFTYKGLCPSVHSPASRIKLLLVETSLFANKFGHLQLRNHVLRHAGGTQHAGSIRQRSGA